MPKKYQVVGACATDIPVATANGSIRVTLYRGNVLPEGVPEKRLEHLLDVGLIKELDKGEDPTPPEADAGVTPPVQSEGGEPKPLNARSPKPDLVEHAVSQGMERKDAEELTRDQLLELYVRKQPETPPAV